MNYIIENNIDFYNELNRDSDDSDDSDDIDDNNDSNNKCLISGEVLTYNYITLSCGHKFNYDSIFEEVFRQKKIYNKTDCINLQYNQIKCPYCRKRHDKLLPYIPLGKYKEKILKVNHPQKDTMEGKKCLSVIKSGKNKGKYCGNVAFESELGCLCSRHHKNILSKTEKHIGIDDTLEMKLNRLIVPKLKEMLKQNKLKVNGKKKDLIDRIIKNNVSLLSA